MKCVIVKLCRFKWTLCSYICRAVIGYSLQFYVIISHVININYLINVDMQTDEIKTVVYFTSL